MNALAPYVEEHGAEEVASTLSALLGKKIGVGGVNLWAYKRTKPPQTWVDALGLNARPSASSSTPFREEAEPDALSPTSVEDGVRQSERPPKALEDAQVTESPVSKLHGQARKNLVTIHATVGAALAVAKDRDGFEHDRGVGGGITALWTDKSEEIADAWIAWGEEGNKFAQAVVRTLELGGAGSTLITGYLLLLLGTGYIMGEVPENQLTRLAYGRYDKYRTVVPEPPRPAASGDDGSAGNGAGDVVAVAPFPASA